jgi:hypothetical protein
MDVEGMAEDVDFPLLVGSAEIDDCASRVLLEIEMPCSGEGTTLGCSLDPRGTLFSRGFEVLVALGPESFDGGVLEACPDFGLPASVESFDSCLEAHLARGREDGGQSQAEAKASHSADRVGELMSSLEAGVVVELSVAGESEAAPVLDERLDRHFGRYLADGPGDGQAAMQGNAVEHLDARAVLDFQAFDAVEGVEFGLALSYLGEMPTARRGWTTYALTPIESPVALQYPTNGPNAGRMGDSPSEQFAADRIGTVFSQVAGLFEFSTKAQHQILDRRICPPRMVGAMRAVAPIDAVEPLPPCSGDPELDGGESDAELACNGSLRHATTDSADHGASLFRDSVFWASSPPCNGGLVLQFKVPQEGEKQRESHPRYMAPSRRRWPQPQSAYGLLRLRPAVSHTLYLNRKN